MSADLRGTVGALLARAQRRYDGTAAAGTLAMARQRLDAPLRVAIAGKVKAGKSTLLNALVGEMLAPTDAGECTRIVTWYRNGLTYRVTLHPTGGGASAAVPFRRDDDALVVRLDGWSPDAVERLEVEWPAPALQTTTLIDTPGIGSLSHDISQRTRAFLVPDDRPGQADAVCYLMRHLHATDVRFLESFHDDASARATPTNAIGVLSRADEVGVGRLDALQTAGRIARRYRNDAQVRRLCQTVLPVAGLLAQTAATLRDHEYRALATLAAADRAAVSALLVSADRFVAPNGADSGDAPIAAVRRDIDAGTRRALLDRLGVFGVRVALADIRARRAPSATALADALARRSGIHELRQTLATQFAARADLLKARSGLATLSSVLRAHPGPGVDDLARDVERVMASTHAFAEARLLNALRVGTVGLDDDAALEAERILGGHGDAPDVRLGIANSVDGPPAVGEVRAAALAALAHWRRRAERPLARREAVAAAAVVVRSCEGVLAALDQPSDVSR